MKSRFCLLPLTLLVLASTSAACSDGVASVETKDAAADGAPATAEPDPPLARAPAPAPRKLSVTDSHACAVVDGIVKCFGTGFYGQLGFDDDPNKLPFEQPVRAVPGIRDAVEVAVSGAQSCARHADGTVSCWGVDRYGGLGSPATRPCGHQSRERCRTQPQKVEGLANAVKIASRSSLGCALLADGTMKCWGGVTDTDSGGLRAVRFADRLVDIGIYRGPCGLTTKGTVLCFSASDKERPKPISTTPNGPALEGLTAVPVRVGYFGGTDVLQRGSQITHGEAVAPFGPVVRVDSGGDYGCALLGDGDVRCWGSPLGNVLGYVGPTRSTNGDADIALADAKKISAEPATDIALAKDWGCALAGRTVTCWGAPKADPTSLRAGQGTERVYYDVRL